MGDERAAEVYLYYLAVEVRPRDAQRVVRPALVNAQQEPDVRPDRAWLYQARITVTALDGAAAVFAPVDDPADGGPGAGDPEELHLRLLFRHHLRFAVGHNVAVDAHLPEPGHPPSRRRRLREEQGLTYAEALEKVKPPENTRWRPFQLAFGLLNLPSLTDTGHPERAAAPTATVDLLFFPTGGGKTKAYLGLTAYTFAIRRLQGVAGEAADARNGGDGVAPRHSLPFRPRPPRPRPDPAARRAVDQAEHRPAVLDDAVPLARRIILAEQYRPDEQ